MFNPLALLLFLAALLPVISAPDVNNSQLETHGWRISDGMPTNWWEATTIEEVEAAFNAARAFENPDLPRLDIPHTTAEWLELSLDERALWLINEERSAREQLPLAGVANNMQQLAQAYADLMYTSNEAGHFANGTHPDERIDTVLGEGCRDSDHVNNIAVLSTGTPFPAAVAVFLWMYSSPQHRDMLLEPYTDDTFDSGHEGYLGIGFAQGTAWTVYEGWDLPTIVVLEMYDPSPQCYAHLTPVPVVHSPTSVEINQVVATNNQFVWLLLVLPILAWVTKKARR